MYEARNVHSDGEDIGAETLYCPREYLVLQFSTKMLQI